MLMLRGTRYCVKKKMRRGRGPRALADACATLPPESRMGERAGAIVDIEDLVERLPFAVYVCEAPTGVIRLYNRRASELWGQAPAAGITDERFCRSLRLFRLDGRLLEYEETPMAQLLRHGDERTEEMVIERADRSRVTVRVDIAALRHAQRGLVGAVGAFQDISGRAQVEEQAARLAAIVTSADDAIISKSLNGHITSWNQAAEMMFGYTESEVLGKSITLIIPPERLHEEDLILSRLRQGERIHLETERVAQDGRRIPISLTVSPIRDRSGRLVGASKVARDISERKRLERESEELLARESRARALAPAASRAKDEVLVMVAHELRNPVSTVMNALTVLDAGAGSPVADEQARRVIRRQARHLARLLDDLLDVARITTGHIDLEREVLDLRAVAEQALEGERHRIEAKAQRVALACHEAPVLVSGDPIRLQQVADNILSNAWKYTPRGGSIRIAVEIERDQAVLRVRDDGAGIPPDRLESVFELFEQVNPKLARTEGGLGIGLTLVKRLVEMHGGTVHARSEGSGRGTEVVVRLPTAVDAPAAPPSPRGLPVAPQRILVIEDNDDGREMLGRVLRIAGHEVVEAATGSEAIEIAARRSPTVVLVDIGLPDLDGYEVARALRRRLGSAVRLVALTGYGQPRDRARSHEAGFDVHLLKPVDPAELAEVLRRLT
jgi:PAS domain S-box-containing protein